MSFIVAAASTAAVSAITGVAGATVGTALTAAIAAPSLATVGALAGGVAAGATAGAGLGAGIGAAGAGITGGDVGKGALSGAVTGAVTGGIAPGLGGATAGLGAVGSGAVTGGIAGAAGSAAGAGAVGEDAGKAALMGGGIGAIGGGLGGMGKGDVAVPTEGTTNPTIDGASATTTKLSPDTPIGNNIEFTPPEIKYNPMAPGTGTVANVAPPAAPITMGDRLSLAGDAFTGGMSAVQASPGKALSGIASPLAEGAMYGGGLDAAKPKSPAELASIGGAPLSPNFRSVYEPTRDTVPNYYADGGLIGGLPGADILKPVFNAGIGGSLGLKDTLFGDDKQTVQAPTPNQPQQTSQVPIQAQQQQPTQPPINSFASMGMQAAQVGQQTVQQQQAQQQQAQQQQAQQIQAQQQPQVQQGIVPQELQPQPAMQQPQNQQPKFYADGGAITATNNQSSFADQVRALAAQKVQAHYAQQAQQLAAQQPQTQQPQPQMQIQQPAQPQQPRMYANGGITGDNLGGYSHGGIAGLTSAVGSGVSDSIPAQIGDSGRQPARLAANEFVIPARAVSELGQGSSEAGAKQLQAMVDRIQAGRKKSIGKGKIAVDSKATKNLPA